MYYTTEVKIDERVEGGWYTIEHDQNIAFEANLPSGGEIMFTVLHTDLDAQDWSLRLWFSDSPGGGELFSFGSPVLFGGDGNINVPRRATTICIQALDAPTNKYSTPFRLPPGTYWVNVENLENDVNGFRLVFA